MRSRRRPWPQGGRARAGDGRRNYSALLPLGGFSSNSSSAAWSWAAMKARLEDGIDERIGEQGRGLKLSHQLVSKVLQYASALFGTRHTSDLL